MFLNFPNSKDVNGSNASVRQNGSALIAVVGVMFLGLIVVAVIASVLTSAFTFSTVARAEVQSQAAAESGIASAMAGLNTKLSCEGTQGTYQSSVVPFFRATVWRSIDGISWIRGCPVSTTKQVRIISTGSAQAKGILNASAGDSKIVEAIFAYGKSGSGSGGGSAMYVYSIGQLDTYHVMSPGGEGSDVAVRTGNFACTGPTIVEGSVMVAEGSANLTNSCVVRGSVLANGSVALTTQSSILGDVTSSAGGISIGNTTAHVGGSVFANGSFTNHGSVGDSVEATGVVTLVQGSSVAGNLLAGSTVAVSGLVSGAITTPGNLELDAIAHVTGNIVVGGTVTYGHLTGSAAVTALHAQGIVVGSISFGVAGLQAPTPKSAPIVADWVDYEYKYSDWQSAGFDHEITWPSALGCRLGDSNSTSPSGALYAFYQQLKNLTVPTVVDARGCSTIGGDISLPLTTDVAFIANNFDVDTMAVWGADSNLHSIWFISPDAQPSVPGPQCLKKGGEFIINSTSTIGSGVNAMAYAPCSIAINNGTEWTGMLYSGDMNGGGGTRVLNYVPMGIPGSAIGGGGSGATFKVGALVLQRNRTNNGE
jgi:cytoskeletal protein CcmA (bactofilin family)